MYIKKKLDCIAFLSISLIGLMTSNFNYGMHENIHISSESSHGNWPWLLKKYGGSLLVGTSIAAFTATGCAQLEKFKIFPFVFPISWIIFSIIRKKLVHAVSRDASIHGIPYDHETLDTSAWVGDWIIYLYQSLHTNCINVYYRIDL